MPEPTDEVKRLSEQEDPWDLDREDPFDNGHGHQGFRQTFLFIERATLTMGVLNWFSAHRFNYPYMERDHIPISYVDAYVFLWWQWIGFCYFADIVPARGCSQGTASFRALWFQGHVSRAIRILQFGGLPYAIYGRWNIHRHAHTTNAMYNAAYRDSVRPIQAMTCCVIFWGPRKYGTRSFYHRYCCEYFPHGRLFRIGYLGQLFGLGALLTLTPLFCLPLMTPSPVMPMIFPLCVFGIKRLQFVLQVPMTFDDAPFKNYSFVVHAFNVMMSLCLMLACGSFGSKTATDVAQFVVIDWVQAFFRIGLQMRIGIKQFPALVRFLLSKVLENIPRPMFNSAQALGDATAMRLHQAFMCVLESICLSIAFQFMMGYLIVLLFVFNDLSYVSAFCPARNIWFGVIFCVSDVTQDLFSERFLEKFSNWSFIYSGMNRGNFALWHIFFMAGLASHAVALLLLHNMFIPAASFNLLSGTYETHESTWMGNSVMQN